MGNSQNSTWEKIYRAVAAIPKGKVASYGQIAALAGNPRMARLVGNALHHNPFPGIIPCHRVVNREGRPAPAFAFGGMEIQRQLLREEGVAFLKNGNVDMAQCRWIPEAYPLPRIDHPFYISEDGKIIELPEKTEPAE